MRGEPLNIEWRPFAIEMDGDPDYWARPWEQARSELRGFIAASAASRQGEAAFRSFHAALEAAVHEQLLELGDESTLIGPAEQAGLDVERFTSEWRNPELAQEAQRRHGTAAAKYGVSGTPTILFPNGAAIHTELVDAIPLDQAVQVFHDLIDVGYEHPYFSKLERVMPRR